MLWRKNKSVENKKKKKKREQEIPLPPTPPSSSSIFSFSWFSKLKKKKSCSSNSETPPLPLIERSSTEPIFSPPSPHPLNHHPSPRPADSLRRLSLGDDLSRTRQLPPLLARCSRHRSTGGDLDSSVLRSDLHILVTERPEPSPPRRQRRRPRTARADRGVLEEIDTDYLNSSNTIKNGRRSFGAKVQPRPRVTVCSPRLRKRASTTEKGSSTSDRSPPDLERYAVAKSSSDPTRDFRESMVDMISEKGIRRPEELERLLACYLSLNSDEHHDAIVKVFRQVWFDLNRRSGRPAGRSHGSVIL